MRRLSISLLSLSLTVFALPMRAQTATFNAYSSPTTTEYQAAIGRPVTSGVLDFYSTEAFTPGARNVLGTWGTSDAGSVNRPSNIGSSTAMFATQLGETVDMYGAGSDIVLELYRPFSLFSIDVAHLYSSAYLPAGLAAFSLTVFGFGPSTDDFVITQTFNIAAPAVVAGVQSPVLQTLNFDNRWRAMDNVWFRQSTSSVTANQFTNVVATIVPEPGTYLLTFIGLAALGVLRLRRRQPR